MCNRCSSIKSMLETAADDPHANYKPVLSFLIEALNNNVIELYAGDSRLNEAPDILKEEMHYTVCQYLRCKDCGQLFFIGACIRGTPVYKLL